MEKIYHYMSTCIFIQGKQGLSPRSGQEPKYDSARSVRFTRKSRRLSMHNYEWSGMYFITIRVREMEPLLERPELRAIVERTWRTLPDRYPGLDFDEYVIMPDHVHFILRLE